MPSKDTAIQRLRYRVYEVLEQGPTGDPLSRRVSHAIALLIVINLAAVILESVPALERDYKTWFEIIEYVSLGVFTVEYALRMWVAVEYTPFRRMTSARAALRYAISPAGIVDLLAVLPFWLALFVAADLRALLVFRVMRFLKLARYSPGMRSLLDALQSERRALLGCLVIFAGITLFSASLMYLAERHVQPDKLGTIPDAMWWAIVTLGTIGYGDIVPATALGRVIATLTIVGGLIMIALPVGIIATAFANEIHRRDFIVTWAMVARVPLFADLEAGDIADIMRLLRAQSAEPGAIIVRRGEPADSMYFIAGGEVDIDMPDRHVRLGTGQFFGEVAVLRRARRSATVTALSRVNLLVLAAHDLHALMQRSPRVAEAIREVVRGRIGSEVIGAKGDIVTEELEPADEPPAAV